MTDILNEKKEEVVVDEPLNKRVVLDMILKEKHDAMATIDDELNKFKEDMANSLAYHGITMSTIDIECATVINLLLDKGIFNRDELASKYKEVAEAFAKAAEEVKNKVAQNKPPETPTT